MSRYIQACDALMLSKKPWRWITVLLIILGDVMQNFTQISTAYGKVSYCEMLIYHMQNQTFAMVTAIILLAILVGDAFRHSGWDAYYIFRTGSRKCLSNIMDYAHCSLLSIFVRNIYFKLFCNCNFIQYIITARPIQSQPGYAFSCSKRIAST